MNIIVVAAAVIVVAAAVIVVVIFVLAAGDAASAFNPKFSWFLCLAVAPSTEMFHLTFLVCKCCRCTNSPSVENVLLNHHLRTGHVKHVLIRP